MFIGFCVVRLLPSGENKSNAGSDRGYRPTHCCRVYGQRKPVVVNRRTGIIEAGNGTLEAAVSLGWSHLAATA